MSSRTADDPAVGSGMISLAIDGGQSALRLRILPDGRTGRGPGYQHGPNSLTATVDAIRTAVIDAGAGELLREARSATAGSVVRGAEPIDTVCLGLAGFPPDRTVARHLAEAIADLFPAREIRLTEDVVTAHAGALAGDPGVVVAAGTGLVCLAIGPDGRRHKVDGHGYFFGDAGSAFAIGRAGLVAVQRSRDGRGPSTALATAALDPVTLYASPTLVADVAAFAPTVFKHAATGDQVARAIITQAAHDIAETITTAVASLPGDSPVPVALVGGVVEAAPDQLLHPLRANLPPRAQLIPPAGTPLDGAERLATGPLGPYADLVIAHP
ncbi:N-acetylglucosamine kinase [Kribbella sp. CA-253562]|uniref:N-acetylglucosamine kinase n=1 Tax=Kribbella sp. CA-253562 TaxID=3239942 RepID=UPI003D8E80F6